MVHLTAAAAHRALVQPVAEIAEVCSHFAVPVVVDTAQALGQIAITGEGAPAAVYGTGRKYLCGPRGVGYLAVRDPWQSGLAPRAPAIAAGRWPGEERPVRRLESRESSIASRVGLDIALQEYLEIGAERVMRGLHEAGRALRAALADQPRWRLRDRVDAPGAIASLVPTDDIDVYHARNALLSQGIVSTAAYPERAPHEMTRPLLRFSPHVDLTDDDIERIVRTLASY
jgi:pyridoxal 5-phosphate dependent beta-lyase